MTSPLVSFTTPSVEAGGPGKGGVCAGQRGESPTPCCQQGSTETANTSSPPPGRRPAEIGSVRALTQMTREATDTFLTASGVSIWL